MYGSTKSAPSLNGAVRDCEEKQPEALSPKVLDLNMEELYQANRLLNQSEMLHYLSSLNNLMGRGYKMNPLEQKLLEEFYSRYDAQYKSPLAMALSEQKDGEF